MAYFAKIWRILSNTFIRNQTLKLTVKSFIGTDTNMPSCYKYLNIFFSLHLIIKGQYIFMIMLIYHQLILTDEANLTTLDEKEPFVLEMYTNRSTPPSLNNDLQRTIRKHIQVKCYIDHML